jgi:trans-aconitate methyltransferase
MPGINHEVKICCFCGSKKIKVVYKSLYHPYNRTFGPFHFYKCTDCGSGVTIPLPKEYELVKLYESFSGGLIPSIRKLREDNPLSGWYNQCINRAMEIWNMHSRSDKIFKWMDIGSGNGELVSHLMNRFPNSGGIAIDFEEKPDWIDKYPGVSWEKTDLNNSSSLQKIGGGEKFDLIFLITVLEHVMYPDIVVDFALRKLKRGGCLYITVPDIGSLPARVLKRKWPYFLPGEHLCIPTLKGMRALLEKKYFEIFGSTSDSIQVNPTIFPYPLGYYTGYFGIKRIPRFLQHKVLKIPTGILEASVKIS